MSTKTVFETLAAEINALRGSPVVAIDGASTGARDDIHEKSCSTS